MSVDYKGLASNFLSLSIIQGLNLILPLITLPYLVRVLGMEQFGLLNFSLAIVTYFTIFVSFGFELSATKDISLNREDVGKINEIFSSVFIIKLFLIIISFGILCLLIFAIPSIGRNKILYFLTFGFVLGNSLFPVWFFQGMEKMNYLTIITVSTKIISTFLIFSFVKTESDILFVPLFNSIAEILGGVMSLIIVFKKFRLTFVIPKKIIVVNYFKNSFIYFLSRLSNNGSRALSITIIGVYFGNIIVGYFSLVEKLFSAFVSIGGIASQTLYPYMNRTKNLKLLNRVILYVLVFSSLILLPLYYYNEFIIEFIFKINNEILSNIFYIIFSASLISIVNSLIGFPLLGAFGYIKYANTSLIYASVIYLCYISLISYFTRDIYLVSFSVVVYHLSSLMFRIYYLKKVNLFKLN